MDPCKFFISKRAICVLEIIIVFTFLFDQTQSTYINSSTCVPQTCGNLSLVQYPFWIPGIQDPICGLSGFDIACHNENPVLKISGEDYIVKNISYTINTVVLARLEVYDGANSCPIPRNNFSVDGTPFSYDINTTDLFFLYNCTSPYSRETYPLDCASSVSQYAFAVIHLDLLARFNYSIEWCQPPVNAPMETNEFGRLIHMNFIEVLRRGFALQWDGNNCSNCVNSGGRCGSYDDEFACFCNDQPRTGTCHRGNIAISDCCYNTWYQVNGRRNPGRTIGIVVGVVAGTAIITCLIFIIYYCCYKKYHHVVSVVSRDLSSYSSSVTDLEKASYFGVHLFNYNELEEATDNFTPSNELGEGGFGTVYKGKLRDGRDVAVKRLYESNYKRVAQFMTEVEILTRLRHQHLVTLYGCTSRHCRELLLVYEYIPNGTVADHLHGCRSRPGSLSWATRMNIAIETASALAFLHASDVIHRDVKTNNILLDNNFCVKVADFGLSRLFPTDVTHVSTAPQGTPGYVDPEYHQCYQLTSKSDVYSFGVILMELISSQPAVDITRHRHEINLSTMAINRIISNALPEFVDPNIGFESDYDIRTMITAVAELGFQCLQNARDMRPTMEEVLEALQRFQNMEFTTEKAEELVIPADDIVSLKSDPLTHSPESDTARLFSRSTASSLSN